VQVLRSGKVNYWTGEQGRLFESEFAAATGCSHAIALASGSAALECALRALGIGPGDDVVTTSRTYIASASCAVALGARPIFADVDRDTQNLTAETIRRALTPATRAIIAVHLAGWPCDMDPILALALELGIPVIEDCAQAQGATYRDRPVGSLGDIAAFSFCQDKIMTTAGEGGMVTTNSTALFESMWAWKEQGKAPFRGYEPTAVAPHESFGTNARLTEVQSAIGRVALRKVPAWLAMRRRHSAAITARLSTLPALRIPQPPASIGHAWYKYYAFVRPEMLRPGWTRDRILEAIRAQGVPCVSGSRSEIYLEPAFPLEWRPSARLPSPGNLAKPASCSLSTRP